MGFPVSVETGTAGAWLFSGSICLNVEYIEVHLSRQWLGLAGPAETVIGNSESPAPKYDRVPWSVASGLLTVKKINSETKMIWTQV